MIHKWFSEVLLMYFTIAIFTQKYLLISLNFILFYTISKFSNYTNIYLLVVFFLLSHLVAHRSVLVIILVSIKCHWFSFWSVFKVSRTYPSLVNLLLVTYFLWITIYKNPLAAGWYLFLLYILYYYS